MILVHDYGSNAQDAWKADDFFWPSDYPWSEELPNLRVWTYGYNWKAELTIGQHGNDLMGCIENHRDNLKRPLLFVCHGIGGLIAKSVSGACSAKKNGADYNRH